MAQSHQKFTNLRRMETNWSDEWAKRKQGVTVRDPEIKTPENSKDVPLEAFSADGGPTKVLKESLQRQARVHDVVWLNGCPSLFSFSFLLVGGCWRIVCDRKQLQLFRLFATCLLVFLPTLDIYRIGCLSCSGLLSCFKNCCLAQSALHQTYCDL